PKTGLPKSALLAALPRNVKLVTLTSNYADHNGGKLLLRLSHLYQKGEHSTLATPVEVDLLKVRALPTPPDRVGVYNGLYIWLALCSEENGCILPPEVLIQ
ncbi:MAG: hypothetical protein SGPRY_006870, partial [Prymnesium sp.]